MYETRLAAGPHNVLNQCRFLETSDASFINHLRCFSGWAEPKVGHPPVSRRKKKRRKERKKDTHSHHMECKYYEIPPSNREQKANKGSVAVAPSSRPRGLPFRWWRSAWAARETFLRRYGGETGRADSLLMIIKFCCFGAIRSVCFAFLSLSSGGKILVKQAKTMKTKRKEVKKK